MNEREIRYLYRILNHGESFSRVHCQDPNKKGPEGALCSTLVKGENAVVDWAKQWNGKGQCYISRNPMLEWNKPGRFTCLTFDIDPVYNKTQGATLVQVDAAIKTGQRILQNFPGGYLATSGNGILLLYTLPPTVTDNLNGTLAPAYKRLSEELKKSFEIAGESCMDILADNMRLVRLIGTKNVKGDKENHRISRFLQLPKPGETPIALLRRLIDLAKAPIEVVTPASTTYEPWVMTALRGEWSDGQRHPTIIKLAGYFGGKRFPADLAVKLITEANNLTPNSPYDADYIRSKVNDIYDKIRRGIYKAEDELSIAVLDKPMDVCIIGEDTESYLKDLTARAVFTTPEIPWPFEDLNRMTWGLPRGALTTLGAWTGKGKTSIAVTVAEHLNMKGKKVLYFPTEMSRKEIKDRYISIATGINNLHLFNGQLDAEEKKLLHEFLPEFKSRPFYLPKTDAPRLNPYELKKVLDMVQPDFLVVDFLQRLGKRSDNRRREVAEFIMTVKDELAAGRIAGLVLSQFHRPQRSQNGKYFPPTLFDFAECGDIENTSDISIILHPPLDEKGFVVETHDGERNKPVLCNVAKNRHGGMTGMTYLSVDTLTTRFSQP